jgi:RNA polymerase sigma-70 factor (ECF subfamily)
VGFASLVIQFLDEPRRAALASRPGDASRLDALEKEALAENPGIHVELESFARFLVDRLPEPSEGAGLFDHVHAGDLLLAWACIRGDARAHVLFETRFGPELVTMARGFATEGLESEDLLQAFRMKVLVGDGERSAKLAEYDGQGFLQNWVRVTALRSFIDMQRAARARSRREEPGSFPSTAPGGVDMELDFLKREYREHFREAFGRALRALDPKDRAMLRHHAAAGLTIDQIAAIYHVHRATAARRVADAKKRFLDLLRADLARATKISEREVDGIMDLIQSQLDVSFGRLLDSTGNDA